MFSRFSIPVMTAFRPFEVKFGPGVVVRVIGVGGSRRNEISGKYLELATPMAMRLVSALQQMQMIMPLQYRVLRDQSDIFTVTAEAQGEQIFCYIEPFVTTKPKSEKTEEKKEEVKVLVVLFGDNSLVAINMLDLDAKDLSKVKPIHGPVQLQSNWKLPEPSPYSTHPIAPQTLQMTNDASTGPVAVTDLKFENGMFSRGDKQSVYSLANGFGVNAETSTATAKTDDNSYNSFPALMAKGPKVYANAQSFVLNGGNLTVSETDAFGYADLTGSDTHPMQPNFIASDRTPYFDAGVAPDNVMKNSTALGVYYYDPTDLFGPTDHLNRPNLKQVAGEDIITAVPVSVTVSFFPNGDGSDSFTVDYGGRHSYVSSDVAITGGDYYAAAYVVPYPIDDKTTFFDRGDAGLLTTMYDTTFTLDQYGTGFGKNMPESWEAFTALMQVSNGHHILTGFSVHTAKSTGVTWPLDQYFFFFDGKDVTSWLTTICKTEAKNIQYAFMDVPLTAVRSIK